MAARRAGVNSKRGAPPPGPRQTTLPRLLAGIDRRSIGRANETVAAVLQNTETFPELIEGLRSADPVLRMRCADAAEKISRTRPDLLQPFKSELLRRVALNGQQEVQWHLAQMLPRLTLSRAERSRCRAVMESYLESKSSIVRTCALQGLADLARQDSGLRETVLETLKAAATGGTPAMKARARRLIIAFERLKG